MNDEIQLNITPQTKRYVVRDRDAKRGKNWSFFPILYQSDDLNRCHEYIITKGLV